MKTIPYNVKDRTRGLGSSDMGSLFGMNRYCPLPKLWLIKTGQLPIEDSTEQMDWGNYLEEPVARRFALKTGRRVQKLTRTIVHPDYDFLLSNPDRWQFNRDKPKKQRRGVLEIKTSLLGNLREWAAGGIPAAYYLQIQHQMACTGCEWGSFAVLFGGNKLVEFDVQRDEPIITAIIERCKDFWKLVQTKTMPPIELGREWNEHMAKFFPTVEKKEEIILATPAALGRARRYLTLCTQVEKREAEIAEHEVFFKEQIGSAERLLVPGVARFTWSSFEQKRVDLEKLRAEHPAIAEQLIKKVPTRRFTVKSLAEVLAEEEEEAEEPMLPVISARRIELE
jgi:putative phage-type endonuclease